MSVLSILVFLPLLAGLVVIMLPTAQQGRYKYIALGATLLQLLLSAFVYINFKTGADFSGVHQRRQFQFVEQTSWINLDLGTLGRLQIDYFMGVDGLSMPFLFLTSLVMFVAVLASWEIKTNLKGYFALFLLLDMAIIGVFVALDFFLF